MISIIVPFYNARTYIDKCIYSIVNQTESDWELILVDDGSTDNSCDVVNKYLADERIHSYRQINAGPSKARNLGLSKAHGEWILFVDADDWLSVDTLSLIHNFNEADMLYFGFRRHFSSHIENCIIQSNCNTESEQCIDTILTALLTDKVQFFGYTWNKFFRRSIIEEYHIRFCEDISTKEDELFCVQYVSHIKSLATTYATPYNYRILDTSLSHKHTKYRNYLTLAQLLEKEIEQSPYSKFKIAFNQIIMGYYINSIIENARINTFKIIHETIYAAIIYSNDNAVRLPAWFRVLRCIPYSCLRYCFAKIIVKLKDLKK